MNKEAAKSAIAFLMQEYRSAFRVSECDDAIHKMFGVIDSLDDVLTRFKVGDKVYAHTTSESTMAKECSVVRLEVDQYGLKYILRRVIRPACRECGHAEDFIFDARPAYVFATPEEADAFDETEAARRSGGRNGE